MTTSDGPFVRAVIPMLVCRDMNAELEFCRRAFGAVELGPPRRAPDGGLIHATLGIADAVVMLHSEVDGLASRAPATDGSSPVVIYLYLEAVDTVVERAVAAGARVLSPPANHFWGDRVARILDPAGHVWNVATRPAAAV